ncbi:hypothetical protein MARCHEWKA_01790 [Brevundimonas phage vB_BpoS-Marchewka]|uniref:Uncharacterized protein n=1 Tax=Brevundimonas phage vB_BpoS-Marchewka TaxID=2948604 RepID=A0A9E7N5A5_9CAUD|nr:hypothetical protein MARCHEWKA_01790 [Brevundimonas phage vB_BpoS-Marchewka]UTC29138.1 hypothetical protein BAMBUS_00550 [Brevundimonas phage vB_BpoS-Bambus]
MRTSGSDNLEKTLHGKPVTQNVFKRAIADALSRMEEGGGALDVLPFLGEEWDTPAGRKVVSQTLINMWKSGALTRIEGRRGAYTVSGGFHRKGLGMADQIEQSILDSIRKRGGFATFAEIMDDHGLRPAGEDFTQVRKQATRRRYGTDTAEDNALRTAYDPRDTTGYAQIKKLLRESEVIRQDLLRIGLYNLPQDELNQMTLRGYFGGLMVKMTVAELGGNEKKQSAARDDFFVQVGAVYNAARRSMGIKREDFVRKPKVAAALYALMQQQAIKRETHDWFAGETQAKVDAMLEQGATTDQVADFREDRRNSREGLSLLLDLLDRFESPEIGCGINIHCWAPVSFYETLARELGIDPVMASRGVLMLDFRGEKLRPNRETPDAMRMSEIEAYREARMS